MNNNKFLLEVKNLKTYFHLEEGILKAVDGVSFNIKKGKTLGLVGESGCGKSVTAQSIMRLEPQMANVQGEIYLNKRKNKDVDNFIDLVKLKNRGKKIEDIRGDEIAMVFQEPITAFSPVHTIGNQIMEVLLFHKKINKKQAAEITVDMLKKVGISNPEQRLYEYPEQLSGGMRQRAMIAMALCCDPVLLIADEPTTALDVTVQAQVLELMKDLQNEFGMSTLFITHDLGVIAEMADEVAVMYLGKIVEYVGVRGLYNNPLHPYTKALLKSIPKLGKKTNIRLNPIEGTVPVPIDLSNRCHFYSRCTTSIEGICNMEQPRINEVEKNHMVNCFLYNKKEKEDNVVRSEGK